MRNVVVAIAVLAAAPAAAQRPVVVELFTSQGCSSCPPADALVAELARTRADLLPLTFHVTYWNNLGWQDPFSFQGATDRQRRYVAQSISPEVYTPALIVDGRLDAVGSDPAAVASALRRAADPAVEAPLSITRSAAGLVVSLGAGHGHGTVLLVGYDRQHETRVARGENGGRTLTEANIVRSLQAVGSWDGSAARLAVPPPAGEAAAVLVQGDDGRILGAARVPAG